MRVPAKCSGQCKYVYRRMGRCLESVFCNLYLVSINSARPGLQWRRIEAQAPAWKNPVGAGTLRLSLRGSTSSAARHNGGAGSFLPRFPSPDGDVRGCCALATDRAATKPPTNPESQIQLPRKTRHTQFLQADFRTQSWPTYPPSLLQRSHVEHTLGAGRCVV